MMTSQKEQLTLRTVEFMSHRCDVLEGEDMEVRRRYGSEMKIWSENEMVKMRSVCFCGSVWGPSQYL